LARDQQPTDEEETALKDIAQETLEEARMVLPGIQALFGFQLIAAFNERFRQLGSGEQVMHYAALVLVAVAIALIMAPAAYHRLAEQRSVSNFFVKLASWLIAGAMVPLMGALCIDVYLVGRVVLGSAAVSGAIALLLLAILTGLWFVFPWLAGRLRHSR
jgi:hypothetical protein